MNLLAYFCNISCMGRIFFIIFASVVLLLPVESGAQERDNKGDRFDKESFFAKKGDFIVTELGLTLEEAAVFIPLSEELSQKRFEAGRRCRQLNKEMRLKEKPTDEEYTRLIDECLTVGLKEAELEKEYYEKFKEILSPEKLYKYKEAEHKFMREFMRTPKGKRGGNKNK